MDGRMSVLSSEAIDSMDAPVVVKPSRNLSAYWLIAPGVLWMALFLVVPIVMIVYVSFWTQTTLTSRPSPDFWPPATFLPSTLRIS